MERKRLERAFGTSVVEGEQGKLYMRVVEKRKPVVKGAPSWDEIAAMHESGSGSRKERDERKEKKAKKRKSSRKKEKRKSKHKVKRRRKDGSDRSSGSDDSGEGGDSGEDGDSDFEGARRAMLEAEMRRQEAERQDELWTAQADHLLTPQQPSASGSSSSAAVAGAAAVASAAPEERCPLRFLARHKAVAWMVQNPETGNVRRADRIGRRQGASSSESDW